MSKDDFYLTLPSNSSFAYYPDNKTSCFSTHLPQRIQLQGTWQVGLVEFHYPQTFANVNQTNNIIYYGQKGKKMQKFKLPSGNYSINEIVGKINSHEDISKFLSLYTGHANGKILAQPYSEEERQSFRFKSIDGTNSSLYVDESEIIIDFVSLSPNLALQLGFKTGVNLMERQFGDREPNSALGIPNQIFIYADIVESQYVGDKFVPLVRNVHVDKLNYLFGSQMVCEFDSPHYLTIARPEFETIEIDLRTDTGSAAPFEFGTSCVKLHFKKVNQYE